MGVTKKLALLGIDATRTALAPLADLVTLGGELTDRDAEGPSYTGQAARDTAETLRALREELKR
jgi:hypothetical protein